MVRMARDLGHDFAGPLRQFTAHNGMIDLFHRAPRELLGQREMRGIVLGHHQATTRVFVKTMHNAGPDHATNAAEFAGAMMQQRMDQSVFFIARRRMHDERGRLVDHEQTVVFVEDIERDVLRLQLRGTRRRPGHRDEFAISGTMRRFHAFPVHANVAFRNETLQSRSRNLRIPGMEKNVEPLAGRCMFDSEGLRSRERAARGQGSGAFLFRHTIVSGHEREMFPRRNGPLLAGWFLAQRSFALIFFLERENK